MKWNYILWQSTIYVAKYGGTQFEEKICMIINKQILIFNTSFNYFH